MNLEYNVVWIDDDALWMRSVGDQLEIFEQHISAQGFKPRIEVRTKSEEIAQPIDGNVVDLLMVDYKLAENTGIDIISELRRHTWLTEIVFYSFNDKGELHDQIAKNFLDGVFVASRESLFDKAQKVFDLSVKKVLDLENMRGLVMAGAADVHHLLTEFIKLQHEVSDAGGKSELHNYVATKLLPRTHSLTTFRQAVPPEKLTPITAAIQSVADEHEPAALDVLLDTYILDSMSRLETVRHVCKNIAELKAHSTNLADLEDLLHWRNALAHQMPLKGDDGAMSFYIKKVAITFDSDRARNLRIKIHEHQALLQTMLLHLRKQQK